MRNDFTISSAVPLMVAIAAAQAGLDAGHVLGASGLDPKAPPVPDAHVDVQRYFEVWNRALLLSGDPAFPLRVAATFQLEDHEVFGFLAMSCKTLREAYDKTAAFRALYCVGARWELQTDPDATRLVWYPWPGDVADPGYRAAMNFAVADMADAIARLGVTQPRPLAVHLAHGAPPDAGPFAAYFRVAPRFQTRLYELIYAPGLTEIPVATFNSRLRNYFEHECRRIVDERAAGPSMTEQVRKQLIGAMDGGDVSIEGVAKQLGLSARSLQRRLAAEQTRYNDVLADIREEFAKRYLARNSLSASEVAYLIGFTERPAFFKAFKRWTGMTPREFQIGCAGSASANVNTTL